MHNLIAPSPWTNGLFDVATEVPEDEAVWDGNGWKLYSACPEGAVWCCEDSVADPMVPKTEPSPGQTINFKPFTAYQITACAAGTSRLPESVKLNNLAASQWLTANMEGWVSAGLELGACDDTPGLIDLEDVTPGTVDGLSGAIARLIDNRLRDGIFDRPIIHVPGSAIPYIADYDTLTKFVDIAAGPGYGVVGPTVVDAGGWAYITGAVEYSLGSRTALEEVDDLSMRRRNYDDSLQEQIAVVRFDPCGGYRTQFTY